MEVFGCYTISYTFRPSARAAVPIRLNSEESERDRERYRGGRGSSRSRGRQRGYRRQLKRSVYISYYDITHMLTLLQYPIPYEWQTVCNIILYASQFFAPVSIYSVSSSLSHVYAIHIVIHSLTHSLTYHLDVASLIINSLNNLEIFLTRRAKCNGKHKTIREIDAEEGNKQSIRTNKR